MRNMVTFPVHDLDLTPFMANFEENKEPVLYDLVAFITHYGSNAESELLIKQLSKNCSINTKGTKFL